MSLEGRHISLIEDDPIMGESLVQSLSLEGCTVDWWKTGAEALLGVRERAPDLVVCDIRLPDTDGETLFRTLAQEGAAPPFLFMTAYGAIDQAVSLIRAGAGDYVTKPFLMDGFISRASALLRSMPLADSACALGISDAIRHVESLLARLSSRSSSVLITGASGTGKEVCARFLHRKSASADRPFIAVNCAAIPAELMESELFGHERGAFTGATSQHKGYAERARNGTLFLDEIGDLPLTLQGKLLRVLEEKRFTRVGGEQSLPLAARTVFATNRNLERMVAEGHFREDLLYRINVVTVRIPPLRERKEDILWLMQRFLEEFRSAGETECNGYSTLAEQAALSHAWPGNVRELRNRVERAMLFADGLWIMPSDLFPESSDTRETEHFTSLRAVRDDAERRQIERALKETGGHVIEAARLLDISRTTLWEKMKRLGIVLPDDA